MLFVDLRLCFLNTSFENGDLVATLASGTAFLYVKDVNGFLDGEKFEDENDECRGGVFEKDVDGDGCGVPNGFRGRGGFAPFLPNGFFDFVLAAGKCPTKVPCRLIGMDIGFFKMFS